MSEVTKILLLGIVVLLTHFLEGITGFGCTIIAMPFAILLVGLEVGRPVLTMAAFLLCLFVTWKDRRRIDHRELFIIVIFMGAGMPIGVLLFHLLPQQLLKWILAGFMILVSVRGLCLFTVRLRKGPPVKREPSMPRTAALRALLAVGGMLHGAFTSGGPLAVVYATERFQDKTIFRATLCAMWSILNGALLVQMLLSGALNRQVWSTVAGVLPFLLAGIFSGNWAHRKIKDTWFTPLSFGVLLVSSVFLFF